MDPASYGLGVLVVEPVVTEEKLRQLLDEGHESASLDFKRACDLAGTAGKVELAKDVAAMQVDGGYIVIGADDHGQPVPDMNGVSLAVFDEANLHKILAKWLPEPFEIRTAWYIIKDAQMVLILVQPNRAGFCVLQKDGQHDGKTAFRAGDVFVRHGSASERWRQDDISRILDKVVAARKEEWRRELREELDQWGVAASAQRLVQGPSANYTWRLDAAVFQEATLELLRSGDDIPIRRLLNEAPVDAQRHLEAGEVDEVETLVGRLACLAAAALAYDRPEWFAQVANALVRVYDVGFDSHGTVRKDVDAVGLWLIVLEHVLALGALAVRCEDWGSVRVLVVQKGRGRDFDYYPTWLRHGLTEAARSNRFKQQQDGREVEVSLISLAARRVANHDCLHPDLPADDDRVLSSICQFDALAAITIIGEMGEVDSRGFYTNFARFYTERTEPALTRLISDATMRSVLFPHSDEDLATAIDALDSYAQKEGFRFSGWWGIRDGRLREFVDENARKPVPDV